MNAITAQEIKRRGIGAVDRALKQGAVRVLKENQPMYVVLSEADYEQMVGDLAEARLRASEADLKSGRVSRGTAKNLMKEIRSGKN